MDTGMLRNLSNLFEEEAFLTHWRALITELAYFSLESSFSHFHAEIVDLAIS